MAEFLTKQFQAYGKNISICRPIPTKLSDEQSKFTALDQASDKSCQILQQVGEQDGKDIYGEISRTNKHKMLKDIFNNLPDLKGGNNG